MKDIKYFILFDFVNNSWGGGNQFLKIIKKYLLEESLYSKNLESANVVLINSHHKIFDAIKAKILNPDLVFIHRIDGPVCYHRQDGKAIDQIIFSVNRLLASGTIFQSDFSKIKSVENGIDLSGQLSTVIKNAPDSHIFYNSVRKKSKKIRLMSMSWSNNPLKGFDVYDWLDRHLDFDRYEMVFIGNSTIKFNNIKQLPPMKSFEIANYLRESDIFLFASKIESCSNALLEALHCGTPVIAYNGSSNPEIVKKGGELFSSVEEIPSLLKKIELDYGSYCEGISLSKDVEVFNKYYDFMEEVFHNKNTLNKNIRLIDLIYILFFVFKRLMIRVNVKISTLVKKLNHYLEHE